MSKYKCPVCDSDIKVRYHNDPYIRVADDIQFICAECKSTVFISSKYEDRIQSLLFPEKPEKKVYKAIVEAEDGIKYLDVLNPSGKINYDDYTNLHIIFSTIIKLLNDGEITGGE